MEKNIRIENIQEEVLLTQEAVKNRLLIAEEIDRRKSVGLVGSESLPANQQILDYLERVMNINQEMDLITDRLTQETKWSTEPKMVLTIPVVGVGGQEEGVVIRSLQNLMTDPLIKSGEVGVLVLVNRPEEASGDRTYFFAQEAIKMMKINGVVLDLDVPNKLGMIEGPFAGEMAIAPNEAPIGILRDVLNICAMKIWKRSGSKNPPILLQMDGDFEGFDKGGFAEVIDSFVDPKINLLQCTSDWDSREFPTEKDLGLWIGSELMRELPLILKKGLNETRLSVTGRSQVIFGEAIQRGIQVPQAERMEGVARKGGYGFQRLKEDELDQNMRISEEMFPGGVRTTEKTVFKWSNRRAVKSWVDLRQPPISQWVNGFGVNDKVRGEVPENKYCGPEEVELSINRTLARFPLPKKLSGLYGNYQIAVLEVLSKYGIEPVDVSEEKKGDDLFYLQIKLV